MEAKIEQLGDVNSLLNSLESEIKSSNAELGLKDEKLLQILCDPENQFASLQVFHFYVLLMYIFRNLLIKHRHVKKN
jgi:hypothetical protein